MRARTVQILLIVAALSCALMACSKKNDGDGEMTCTPSNKVTVRTGLGEENGTCTQLESRFRVNEEMWGCAEFQCLDAGDRITFEWERPNGSLRDRDETVIESGKPRGWKYAAVTRPDGTGTWKLEVFRNGRLSGARSFFVQNN